MESRERQRERDWWNASKGIIEGFWNTPRGLAGIVVNAISMANPNKL